MTMIAFPALGTDRDKCCVSGKFSARMRIYNEAAYGSMADRLVCEVTSPPRYPAYWDAERAANAYADAFNLTGVLPDMSEGA
jgi:hypothetical protein